MAGAAVESGRMFPEKEAETSVTGMFALDGPAGIEKVVGSYVQSAPPSPDASPIPSASCRWLVGAQVLIGRIVSHCFPVSSLDLGVRLIIECLRCGVCVTQNVPVLEILGVWTHLQVFFERFLTLDGGEGRLVHGGGGVFVCHVDDWYGGELRFVSGGDVCIARGCCWMIRVGGATYAAVPGICLGVCGELAADFTLALHLQYLPTYARIMYVDSVFMMFR